MSGFTEVFGGLGALLGFIFSLGIPIGGDKRAIDLLLKSTDFVASGAQVSIGNLTTFIIIVSICGILGAVVGAIVDGASRK